MKTIFKTGILSLLFVLFSSFSANAITIPIHTTFTANGCEWDLVGTIDVGFDADGMFMSGYDVTLSGPCGTHHLSGVSSPNNGGNGTLAWQTSSSPIAPTTEPLDNITNGEVLQFLIQYVINYQ